MDTYDFEVHGKWYTVYRVPPDPRGEGGARFRVPLKAEPMEHVSAAGVELLRLAEEVRALKAELGAWQGSAWPVVLS